MIPGDPSEMGSIRADPGGCIEVVAGDEDPRLPATVEAQLDEYYRRVRFNGQYRNILAAYNLNGMSLGIAEEGVE